MAGDRMTAVKMAKARANPGRRLTTMKESRDPINVRLAGQGPGRHLDRKDTANGGG